MDLNLNFNEIFVEPDELLANNPDRYVYLLHKLITKLYRNNDNLCICGNTFSNRHTRKRHLNNNCPLINDISSLKRVRN